MFFINARVPPQVSHHPPISACHAQGANFTLWQDVRIKTKFWGKSLEFQPSGESSSWLSCLVILD